MNTRKAVAAAFGTALLAAGTGVVTQSHAAHGILSSNSTGAAKNTNKATGGLTSALCDDCSPTLDAPFTASKVAGSHSNGNRNHQKNHFKTTSGNANGSTHGSAKSGSQSFRIK